MQHLISTLTLLAIAPSLACGRGQAADRPYRATHFALGTACSITLYESRPETHLRAAFALLDDIEERMSATLPGSEVSAVNAAAGIQAVAVSPDTFEVVLAGLGYAETSGGRFDITVSPLVALWGIGTADHRVPEQGEIDAALSLLGSADVVTDSRQRSVFLPRRGMALDLGGIAKGYAADAVVQLLGERGVSRGLVDLGGNIVVFGAKPSGRPWRIGVQDPYDSRGRHIATTDVAEGAVATSGVYERFFEQDGVRYHHILDTATGFPVANALVSVTIVGPDGITADAWSTIAFTMGLDQGMAAIEAAEGIEGVFVTKDRTVHLSSGLAACFVLTSSEYRLESP